MVWLKRGAEHISGGQTIVFILTVNLYCAQVRGPGFERGRVKNVWGCLNLYSTFIKLCHNAGTGWWALKGKVGLFLGQSSK